MGGQAYPPDTSWARRPLPGIARELILSGILGPIIAMHDRPRVYGRSHLRDLEPPAVFASNHASHLDTPLIMGALPYRWRRRTAVVAAADHFYRSRITGFLVSLSFAAVPVERDADDTSALERIEQLLDERWNVLLYPEGTRSRDGNLGPLHSGAAVIGVRRGSPIVPIHVHGTHESMPPGSSWPRPHPVTVEFGGPLRAAADEQAQALTARLREALLRLAAAAELRTES